MNNTAVTPCGLTVPQLEKIKSAVHLSGGQTKVAHAMGYKFGESVRRFTSGIKLVPAERVADFQTATQNRLTLAEIRPDLYASVSAEQLAGGQVQK